MQTKEYNIFS